MKVQISTAVASLFLAIRHFRFSALVVAWIAVAALLAGSVSAGPLGVTWVRQFPLDCACVATAATGPGRVYVGGSEKQSLQGQPFAGEADAFVRSYDESGNVLWTREFGTPDIDAVIGLTADASGVYAVGFEGLIEKGGNNPRADGFAAKYSPSGTLLWMRMISTVKQDEAYGVTLDAAGEIYVTGTTHGTLPGQISAGRADVFVAKFTADGSELWAHQFGTPKGDFGEFISIASHGAIYLAGATYGTFPGMVRKGGFVARLDREATKIRWVRGRIGGRSAQGLLVNGTGIYVTFSNSILRHYAPTGELLWGRRIDDVSLAAGISMSDDSIVIGGWTPTPLPGQTGLGGSDAFVRGYSIDGSELWTNEFGTQGDDRGLALTATDGGIYVAGLAGGQWATNDVAGHGAGFLARL